MTNITELCSELPEEWFVKIAIDRDGIQCVDLYWGCDPVGFEVKTIGFVSQHDRAMYEIREAVNCALRCARKNIGMTVVESLDENLRLTRESTGRIKLGSDMEKFKKLLPVIKTGWKRESSSYVLDAGCKYFDCRVIDVESSE